jgi:hypothetical protein
VLGGVCFREFCIFDIFLALLCHFAWFVAFRITC